MRTPALSFAAACLVAGCAATVAPPDTPTTSWTHAAAPGKTASRPDTAARMAMWEQEWQGARQRVAAARTEAMAAGAAIPPEVDSEVSELMNRQIDEGPDEEARIEDLQNAVSDALRLAELLSIG